MKNYRLAIFLSSCFIIFLCSTLNAQNLTYGCVKKAQGQFRVVSDPSDCNPSEYPIALGTRPLDQVTPLILYVDGATGIDNLGYGLTQDKPFKTIGYALGRIPILRTADTSVTINVAAGQYRESIKIGMGGVWLKGAGPNATSLVGDGSTAVVQLYGPLKGGIAGFTITNGGTGIYSSTATMTIENCVITGNRGYGGLEVYNNSFMNLTNVDITSNNVGIALSRNSGVVLDGCNISSNSGHGLMVWYTSTARLKNCEVSRNGGNGIQAGAGSSLRMWFSRVYYNTLSGLDITQQATLAARGGNVIYSNGDGSGWRAGIGAYHGSSVVFTLEDTTVMDRIYDNNGPGLFISNNSSVFMKLGQVTHNNGNGVTLSLDSTGQFEGGASSTLNNGFGVACYNGSVGGLPGDLSGNGSGPTNCIP